VGIVLAETRWKIESLLKRLPVKVRRSRFENKIPPRGQAFRAATSVDSKFSKLLENKGGNRKLASP